LKFKFKTESPSLFSIKRIAYFFNLRLTFLIKVVFLSVDDPKQDEQLTQDKVEVVVNRVLDERGLNETLSHNQK